ncbi:hypothetical protein MBAV_005335 [Candidatus Magnetobacterium bavaricum]|uniref:Uncharacterized protein n=1 Tax=Candidatus Magnetobacterium bavaricum TaxID=29290 RepID=A0A0F3GKQ3_9BACT|nr:hypothetical protein MBAV_005335 [Candidatus Magnetobacterium bavaricum]
MTVTAVFQVCHSWLDQESRICKNVVTMEYKEDTFESTHKISNVIALLPPSDCYCIFSDINAILSLAC